VHPSFSHDGSLTITELAHFYSVRGFQFIAIGPLATTASSFFSTGPQFEISWTSMVLLRVASGQLSYVQQARALALRWFA